MPEFHTPPVTHNAAGEVRRVGVELEFIGVELADAADAAAEALGGRPVRDTEYRYTVDDAEYGPCEVAFDTSVLRDGKSKDWLDAVGLPSGERARSILETVFAWTAWEVVPREVVTPPIPLTDLAALNRLEAALRSRGARGTGAGVTSAFALHFNAEAADPADADALTGHLRAFLLLYHWLFRRGRIDATRRLLPFVTAFPEEYARLVIDLNYKPSLKQLAMDYMRHNPSRNRPLDMMPLIAFNGRGWIAEAGCDSCAIKGRPAYHYRLPNSEIDDPQWSIAAEWNKWVAVERLAADADALAELSETYLGWENTLAGYLSDEWVEDVERRWGRRLLGASA